MSSTGPDERCGAVLFTDLVGFTAYTDLHGDRAAVELLDRQTSLVAPELDGCGRIVKELGDGLMVWFDHPPAGLTAARSILGVVNAARDAAEFPLAVRMGMHVGDVLARGDDVVGQTVNIAARVADLAAPGELLVTESFVAALADPAAPEWFRPVGPTRVKGVGTPIWLHRLAT